MSLEANLSAWQTVDASLRYSSDRRFATYRAFQVRSISSLDDRSDFDEAPEGAAFYISRIYWGYSYEAIFDGDRRRLNAAVGASLSIVSGQVSSFADGSRLRSTFSGIGLRPKSGSALFARAEDEVMSAYDTDGAPAPVFVDYRAIPGRPPGSNVGIALDPGYRVTIRFRSLYVVEDGTWFSTPWNLKARCFTAVDGPSAEAALVSTGRVDARSTHTLDATLVVNAAVGETIECTTEGTFTDYLSSGPLASGRSNLIVMTEKGGNFPLAISASGKTAYQVNADVEVAPFM